MLYLPTKTVLDKFTSVKYNQLNETQEINQTVGRTSKF